MREEVLSDANAKVVAFAKDWTFSCIRTATWHTRGNPKCVYAWGKWIGLLLLWQQSSWFYLTNSQTALKAYIMKIVHKAQHLLVLSTFCS